MVKFYVEYGLIAGALIAVIVGPLGHRWANVAAAAVGLFYLGLLLNSI
jgi:hypothetical protein